MYTAATLLDMHGRAHESFRRLIAFCGDLTDDELHRPLTGFGFPTGLSQLEHTIGAEVWAGMPSAEVSGAGRRQCRPNSSSIGTTKSGTPSTSRSGRRRCRR